MPKAIGIDLGTTFTCVAYIKDDEVEVVANHHGNKITPSVVHFGPDFTNVGEDAMAERGLDPQNTIFQVKRFMGRDANDREIKKRNYPFEVVASEKGNANIRVSKRKPGDASVYCPEQISAFLIRYAKALAAESIGDEVTEAVITVPANFTNAQRQATKDAAEIAGLKVLRIVNEPTAAALAYGFERRNEDVARVVLVYDLGGGTFDVSIVKIHGTEANVMSTKGLTFLGGEDFDYRLYEEAVSEFKAIGVDIPNEREFALYQSCELAKRTLSTCETADIETFDGIGERKTITVTRETFEELCHDLFEKTIDCVKDAIKESGLKMDSIDDVVLVGGSSRIPRVQELLQDLFANKKLKFDIPPDHAVAHGAAILASTLSGKSGGPGAVKLVDVTPFTLGIRVPYDNMQVLIPRNSRYPTTISEFFSNADEMQTSLRFQIYEGECAIASQNNLLGKLDITCPPRPIGKNEMEATFSIDADGILHLNVQDIDTGEAAQITVEMSKLSMAERNRMMVAANIRAEQEAVQRAKMEARTAFSDALLRMKASIRRVSDLASQKGMLEIVQREEKWISCKMLSRVAECTARTPTDIRIYAEKAAFEGQALRSMINGLQTRTKHKLSDVTKSFAEKCYEERLFFYFCETLRICIEDRNGEIKASEILQVDSNEDEPNLRSIWEPLFTECSDVIRSNKSLEAANIRLSKLSELWKKRACSQWLISLVYKMAESLVMLNDKQAESYADLITGIIQLPCEVEHLSQVQLDSLIGSDVPSDDQYKRKCISVVESTEESIRFVSQFAATFVETSRCETLRIVCRERDSKEFIFSVLASLKLSCDLLMDRSSNFQPCRPQIVVIALEYFAPTASEETGTVIFFGIEDLYIPKASSKSLPDESVLHQFIADIYVRGRMMQQQMSEIAHNINMFTTRDSLKEYHKSWPTVLQNDIPLEDLYFVVSYNRGNEPSYVHFNMQEHAHKRTVNLVYSSLPPLLANDSKVRSLAYNFQQAGRMKIDEDYWVTAVTDADGPTVQVEMRDKNVGYGVKQFIELRHGCKLSSLSGPSRPSQSIIDTCDNYIVVLSADRFRAPISELVLKPKETSNAHMEHVRYSSTPSVHQVQGYRITNASRAVSTTVQTQRFPLHSPAPIFNQAHSSGLPSMSPSSFIEVHIDKKRTLHKQMTSIARSAQMVMILREPVGEQSPQDLRCDGFIEKARERIKTIRINIKAIDEALGTTDPYLWPDPCKDSIKNIASDNGVDQKRLKDVVAYFNRRQSTFSSLQEKIGSMMKLNDNRYHWDTWCKEGKLNQYPTLYALTPDTVSEATSFLQDLQLVELPKDARRIQYSSRYIADCSFYKPTNQHFDEGGLLALEGASKEYFAIGNFQTPKGKNEKAIAATFDAGEPIFFFPCRVRERIARDLVANGLVNCSDASLIDTRPLTYETLTLPYIYDPVCFNVGAIFKITWLQSFQHDFGCAEWMKWICSRLITTKFSYAILYDYHRRAMAEREFCLRDELLIQKLHNALANPKLPNMQTKLNEITMDSFVNGIVEKITRGERLVEIQPLFADKATAEKLTRFIRSRRMPPTEY